ncbi:MAG: ABC transporter ATP-binding protein [Candidatus Heimdallarchaeum aukensis]|uniref:ABC transporter ATP-binding protein n=1 Tax=Candidatus Heimdallarchaeum aukensis TaxID=2876573 RepID=A0A9Y1FM47_9ARCH|nr:MAG: ABC transporter ATP-binding protein [Candidatus Heimdallarchaeum aukensis]
MIKIENIEKTYFSKKIEFTLFVRNVKKKGKEIKKSKPTASSISETKVHYNPLFKTEKKKTYALRGISLNIREGEIFGLLGPNGAGKTTLTKIISTLIIPDKGNILVNGYNVVSKVKQARASIGLVTGGERSLYWKLTPLENLSFFGRMYYLSKKESLERAKELIEIFGLEEKKNDLVQNLSTGQKMKVAFARALMHDPPVLLLDEYNRGLDPQASKDLRDFIKKVLQKEQNKTILLCTHDMVVADNLSDRVGLIFQGKIVALDTPEKLKSSLKFRTKLTFVTDKPIAPLVEKYEGVSILTTKNVEGENTTILTLKNGLSSIEIMDYIRGKDCFIKNFEVNHASLEDVFLSFTGRKLEEIENGEED